MNVTFKDITWCRTCQRTSRSKCSVLALRSCASWTIKTASQVSPWCHLFIVNIVCIHYVNKTHLLFQLPVHTLSSVAHYIPLFTNVAYTLCYMDVMSCCVFCSHINSTLLYYALSHCSISLCIISFCNLDNLGNKAYEIF